MSKYTNYFPRSLLPVLIRMYLDTKIYLDALVLRQVIVVGGSIPFATLSGRNRDERKKETHSSVGTPVSPSASSKGKGSPSDVAGDILGADWKAGRDSSTHNSSTRGVEKVERNLSRRHACLMPTHARLYPERDAAVHCAIIRWSPPGREPGLTFVFQFSIMGRY
jgi:hypothetical protein